MDLNPNDEEVRAAVFGEQVQQFLASDIGVYLMQCADKYAQDASDQLAVADPEDPKVIRALQNKIQIANLIAAWLNEATALGYQALQHLQTENMQ